MLVFSGWLWTCFCNFIVQVINSTRLFLGFNSCNSCRCHFHHSSCTLEKPIHVIQGMEEAIRGYDWQRRPFSGNSLCSICWSSNSSMAFGCVRILFGRLPVQLFPRLVCWSYCLPGIYGRLLRFFPLIPDCECQLVSWLYEFPGRFSSDGICVHCGSDFFV